MKTSHWKLMTGTSILGVTFTLLSSPAWGFDLTINPPPTLTLDGLSIREGQFNLTEATGFFLDTTGTVVSESLITAPVSIDAVIGSSGAARTLISDIEDDKFEVINFAGFFDPIDPDLPEANFNITLTNLPSSTTGDFTYFLPVLTSQSIFQLTDLGATTSLSDNINTFSTAIPEFSPIGSGTVVPGGTILTRSTGNNCASPIANFHGGGGGNPPPPCVVVPESSATLSILVIGLVGTGLILKRKS